MKKHLSDYLLLFLIAGVLIALDQLTKSWVRQNLAYGEVYRPDLWLSNYARIVHVKNTGAAFGMFQSLGNVFMLLSFVVSGVILYYYSQVPRKDWLIRVAMGFLLGGAIGNLIDRLAHGHVTDFISVGDFPVLNLADASISTGVAILFVGMWLQEKRKKAQSDPDHPNAEAESAGLPEEIRGE